MVLVKKDLAEFLLQGLNLDLSFCPLVNKELYPLTKRKDNSYLFAIAACAAASLAIGTRNGEQDT